MIGNIEIKTLVNFDQFKDRPLPIVEAFGNTVQGEGPRLRPAIFIRTGLCNFTCEGFGCTRQAPNGQVLTGCDTIHAVSPKFKDTWVHYKDYQEIVQRVQPIVSEASYLKQDIIITGGEPTMHWNNKTFQQMLHHYLENGHHLTVESNGSKMIEFTEDYQKQLQFSLSVKLEVSGEKKEIRLNFDALENIFRNTKGSYFKFVVNPDTWDSTKLEIDEILEEMKKRGLNPDVYLMPLGENIQKQMQNIRKVVEICSQYGYAFSPRAHILAFDDMDGV